MSSNLPVSNLTRILNFTRAPADGASSGSSELGALPVWDLSDLYNGPDDPAIAQDLEQTEKTAKDIRESYQGKLARAASDGAKLGAAISKYEALADKLGKLGSYVGLYYQSDLSDPERAKFYGDISEKLNRISTDLIFFELEFNTIDEGQLTTVLEHPDVSRFKPWIEDIRKDKPHQREEIVETLFHEKSQTGRGAWTRLFNETMTSLQFEVDGEVEPLGLEATLNMLTSPDGARREAASQALSIVFKDNVRLFTLITNTLAKDKEVYDRWHGFDGVADSRHLANRVEGPVVDALVEAVRSSYPRLSHRYYAMKAKWLGQEQLSHWDRNAPLPDKPERVIGWAEAQDTVLTAYAGFAPEMSAIAKEFFDKGWIDAPVRKGKAQGAFSHSTVPSVHPYVLLNYQGKPRDVMTLAHELGHGVHQMLARQQGPLMAPTPLTLAETASVFGEMLTFKALLKETTDAKEKKAMIAGKVEDMLNTVVRQIAFYCFEREVHEARRSGELTSDQIGDIWTRIQAESLGPAIALKPGYEVFWSYVPHFIHSPFYVYAYAFGDCLVNSLYGLYQEAHPGFVDKYFELLKAGGTKHHSEILAPFSLDARDPAFWSKGLGVIEAMIDELEEMDKTT